MSGQLRTLKNRIRSVENTKKITRAMEMVAAAKLRRFQNMMQKARPYTEGLQSLLNRLKGGVHPFFEQREEKRCALLLMTSDTGLCGSYNTNLISLAAQFFEERKTKPLLIGIGKFGINAFKRMGVTTHTSITDLRASRVEEVLSELKTLLEKLYLSEEVHAIYVVYSHFLTVSKYKEVLEKLLPFEQSNAGADPRSHRLSSPHALSGDPRLKHSGMTETHGSAPATEGADYIFEPSKEILFEKLVPAYFEAKVRMTFLESFVSEQIARMTAMHQATDNAKEMIDLLVLQRNKARQAAITKEIIEIVSGSRALKIK